MNKYQELVETALKSNQIFNVLKTKIIQEVTTKLSAAWGCEKDCISFEFGRAKYYDKNKIISWDFALSIMVNMPHNPLTISLPGFSINADKDSEMDPILIKYRDKSWALDQSLEDLSEVIFQETQKKIEGGSWFKNEVKGISGTLNLN